MQQTVITLTLIFQITKYKRAYISHRRTIAHSGSSSVAAIGAGFGALAASANREPAAT